jgi:hypothetical protein
VDVRDQNGVRIAGPFGAGRVEQDYLVDPVAVAVRLAGDCDRAAEGYDAPPIRTSSLEKLPWLL